MNTDNVLLLVCGIVLCDWFSDLSLLNVIKIYNVERLVIGVRNDGRTDGQYTIAIPRFAIAR